MYRISFALFSGLFLFAAVSIARYHLQGTANAQAYGALQERMRAAATASTAGAAATAGMAGTECAALPGAQPTADARIESLRTLHAQNADCIGWIRIPGTRIDYPLMHTPSEPEQYLKRDFEKKDSPYGVPFLEAKCDWKRPSDNLILYGHHMKDGSMFADLLQYADERFSIAHPRIELETLDGRSVYRIIAVFKAQADSVAYNRFVDARDAAEFDAFVQEIRARSLYAFEESAAYGDKLITLSTCEYTLENGRMVVVGKRVE